MKRKQIVMMVIAVALLMSAFFTACGSTSSTGNDSSTSTNSTSAQQASAQVEKKESVTLSVILNKDWYDETTKWLFEDYQAKTGNKLDTQITAGGQAFNDALTTKAAVNELPDIVFMYPSAAWIRTMGGENNLVDLTNEPFISKISDSMLKSGAWLKYEDKIYAIPTGGFNCVGVVYNKDIFSKNNIQIPKTYDEFLTVCEKLKNAGITPVYEGIKDGWPPLLYNFIGFANEFTKKGAIEQMNAGKFDFTKSDAAKRLLERQHELFAKGYLNKDTASATYDMEIAAFGQQKAAMFVQFDSAVQAVLEKFPDASKFIGMFQLAWDDDSVVPVDMQKAISISKGKHIEEAKDFLAYCTADETLNTYYSKLKAVPCYKGVTAELNPGTSDMVQYINDGKTVPFYSSLVTPGINIGFDLAGAILGAKPIDKVLQEAQAQYIKSGKDNKIAGF